MIAKISLLAAFVAAPAGLVLAAGTAAPKTSPTPAPTASPAPPVEMILPEGFLERLLEAAAPFETDLEQEVGLLGFARTLQVHVVLSEPDVRVRKDGVHVTLKYHLTDPSGTLDTRGTASPILQLVVDPARNVFEGRLTDFGIQAMGVPIPVEQFVDPIEFPSMLAPEIELEEKTLVAETRITDVVLEPGQVRLKGRVTFRPAKAATGKGAPAGKSP